MNHYSIEDEELYPEIKIVKKEIRNLNKELKNLKNEYYIMEEQNLTYKYMIEKILKTKNRNQQNNNNENNTINEKNEEENSCMKEQTNEDEEFKNNDNRENNTSKKKKYKKNKPKSDAEIKISVLKKQNSLYETALQQNNNRLEGLRKNEKAIQYQQLVSAINSKNDELDENLKKFDKLNQSLMEYETKIKYYMVKAQIFSNDNFKIDGDMEENKKMVERFDDEIKDFTTKKESLNKKISQKYVLLTLWLRLVQGPLHLNMEM
jgi:chromosome segregation ATPase